jgi:hypothetical protein
MVAEALRATGGNCMRHITSSAVLIGITVASCRHQAPLTVNPAVYPVVSADGDLLTGHFTNDTHAERTLSRAVTGDTTEHESLRTRIDEIVGGGGGESTILRVTTGHYAGGDYFDSLVVRRGDLRPVRERLVYLQRHTEKRFAYDGRTVHQTNTSGDSAVTFDRRYDLPVFAFGEIEMLVRSLPYRMGYTAILPLYSEGDDAIEMDSVAVVAARADLWTVRFADPAIVAMYRIDAASRRIVSWDVTNRKTNGKARKIYEALGR